jgi:hypothetical protein
MERAIEVMRQSVHEPHADDKASSKVAELGLLRRVGTGPTTRYEVLSP